MKKTVHCMPKVFGILLLFILTGCKEKPIESATEVPDCFQVGILVMDGVYNTELTAPYDIFQHTIFRKGIKPMCVFTVAEKKKEIRSFEGLQFIADYMFDSHDLPTIDILVVPSAEHHLDTDLENKVLIDWVRETAKNAQYVTSHCDGSFVLAKAGVLDGLKSTTFPSDIPSMRKMFPHLDVIEDVLFVHDDKCITSAGGAKSFEAALYLCHILYGDSIATQLANGLVIDWELKSIPHMIVP